MIRCTWIISLNNLLESRDFSSHIVSVWIELIFVYQGAYIVMVPVACNYRTGKRTALCRDVWTGHRQDVKRRLFNRAVRHFVRMPALLNRTALCRNVCTAHRHHEKRQLFNGALRHFVRKPALLNGTALWQDVCSAHRHDMKRRLFNRSSQHFARKLTLLNRTAFCRGILQN